MKKKITIKEGNMPDKIKCAKLLATFIHFNQKRSDGEDYIKHCERVVSAYIKQWWESLSEEIKHEYIVYSFINPIHYPIEVENAICVAWMHDCLEDCKDSYYLHAIMIQYFGVDITNLVVALTHITPDKGSYDEDAGRCLSYNEYIERVARNPQALQIKFLDMIDNTSYPIPEKQWLKYRNAIIHLIGLGNPISIPKVLITRLKLEHGDKL